MSTEALSPYTREWGTGGPTGTFTHSKQFAQRLRGVLSRINARIREAIIERDLFNLQTESLEVNELPEQAYEFETNRQKVRGFLRWLRNQLDEEFLTIVGEDNNQFIRAAYLQGIRTAYNELQNEGADLVRPDPEDLLNRPIHSTTLRDIYTRTYENLVSVRDDTAQAVREELTKGFAEGKNPTDIARNITGRVDSIGKHRSTLIARTEIINAHSQASLNTYESVNKDTDLDIAVKHGEWMTAEDDRVCPICSAINGAEFLVSEMKDKGFEVDGQQFNLRPPAHPNCRCTVKPVVGIDTADLKPLSERLPSEEDIGQEALIDFSPELHPRNPETGKFIERPGAGLVSDIIDIANNSIDLPDRRDVINAPVSEGGLRELPEYNNPRELVDSIPTIDERFGDELDDVPVSPDNDLSQEGEEAMRDAMANHVGNFKDEDLLEEYYSRQSHILGKSNDRSGTEGHASIGEQIPGDSNEMAYMSVTNPTRSDRTIKHEQTHTIHHAMGYSSGGETAGASGGFKNYTLGEGGPDIEAALQRHENDNSPPIADKSIQNLLNEVGFDDSGVPEKPDPERVESGLGRELTGTHREKFRKLVAEANAAFVRTQGVKNREGNSEAGHMVKRPYSMSNGNEFMADFGETMQSGDKMSVRKYVEYHPELVGAYTSLFDVPEETQEVIDFRRGVVE